MAFREQFLKSQLPCVREQFDHACRRSWPDRFDRVIWSRAREDIDGVDCLIWLKGERPIRAQVKAVFYASTTIPLGPWMLKLDPKMVDIVVFAFPYLGKAFFVPAGPLLEVNPLSYDQFIVEGETGWYVDLPFAHWWTLPFVGPPVHFPRISRLDVEVDLAQALAQDMAA